MNNLKHIKNNTSKISNVSIKKKLVNAFTLLEIIIYVGIFSIFFVGVIGILLSVSKNGTTESRKRDLTNVVNYISQHLQDSFNQAQEIETPQYTNANNPGSSSTLRLGNIKQGSLVTDPNRIQYFLEYDFVANNKISFYTGAGSITPTMSLKDLTDPNYVNIVSVNFYPLPPNKQTQSTNPSGVKAVIVFQSPSDSSIQLTLQNVYLL